MLRPEWIGPSGQVPEYAGKKPHPFKAYSAHAIEAALNRFDGMENFDHEK